MQACRHEVAHPPLNSLGHLHWGIPCQQVLDTARHYAEQSINVLMCVAHLEIRKNNTEEGASVYKGGAELAYVAILIITSANIYLNPHMLWPGILAPAKGWG